MTRDDPAPGLLAKLTGALLASDVNLHTAQVFTRENTPIEEGKPLPYGLAKAESEKVAMKYFPGRCLVV